VEEATPQQPDFPRWRWICMGARPHGVAPQQLRFFLPLRGGGIQICVDIHVSRLKIVLRSAE